jgi:hypothetical protein
MLSEEVALRSIDPDRLKAMSLEQLEEMFARAAKENADYLRQCEEDGVLPNGVIAGRSCWLARMAEAEILERKLKLPEFQAELEAEMEAIKARVRQEKEQKGYVYPDFRAFLFLQEIGKRDPEFIRELDLAEYVHPRSDPDA